MLHSEAHRGTKSADRCSAATPEHIASPRLRERRRVCATSYASCIRSRWSIAGPNAFSMRSAISGVTAALPRRRSESVARHTFKTFAAFVTVSPSASMISVPQTAAAPPRSLRRSPSRSSDRTNPPGGRWIGPPWREPTPGLCPLHPAVTPAGRGSVTLPVRSDASIHYCAAFISWGRS